MAELLDKVVGKNLTFHCDGKAIYTVSIQTTIHFPRKHLLFESNYPK